MSDRAVARAAKAETGAEKPDVAGLCRRLA